MTPIDIDALRVENAARRARKDAATPGPWSAHKNGSELYDKRAITRADGNGPGGADPLACGNYLAEGVFEQDATFIVMARTDPVEGRIDALITEVERLRQVCKEALELWDRGETIDPEQGEVDQIRASLS